jgi:hypothetical protein
MVMMMKRWRLESRYVNMRNFSERCVCGDDGGYFDERDVKMKERENWDG